MKQFFRRINILGVAAFVSGFVLMVYELAGARILAPSIGSSTYVWTSVIGIIIAALSIGYWLGGKLADLRGHAIDVAVLSLASAGAILYTLLLYPVVLSWVTEVAHDPRLGGVLASLLLFAPTSLLLGMLSPYLAKRNVKSLKDSGSKIASLSALNSIGGITGTFITGFILFGYIGSRETLVVIIILMVGMSWLFRPTYQWLFRTLLSFVIVLLAFIPITTPTDTIDIETPSSHYSIVEVMNDLRPVRGLMTGPGALQSGIRLDSPSELAFWYTQQFASIVEGAASQDRILILGGGAMTLPGYLAEQYPESQIDVVEIDPKLIDIAREYFEYKDPENVAFIAQDARIFVNESTDTYDIILVDAFSDLHVPYSLMTKEYGDRINALLKVDGVVAVNMIAGLRSHCYELLKSISAPYQNHFEYAARHARFPESTTGNVIALFGHNQLDHPGYSELTETGTLYTDNFVPSERLQSACIW